MMCSVLNHIIKNITIITFQTITFPFEPIWNGDKSDFRANLFDEFKCIELKWFSSVIWTIKKLLMIFFTSLLLCPHEKVAPAVRLHALFQVGSCIYVCIFSLSAKTKQRISTKSRCSVSQGSIVVFWCDSFSKIG